MLRFVVSSHSFPESLYWKKFRCRRNSRAESATPLGIVVLAWQTLRLVPQTQGQRAEILASATPALPPLPLPHRSRSRSSSPEIETPPSGAHLDEVLRVVRHVLPQRVWERHLKRTRRSRSERSRRQFATRADGNTPHDHILRVAIPCNQRMWARKPTSQRLSPSACTRQTTAVLPPVDCPSSSCPKARRKARKYPGNIP